MEKKPSRAITRGDIRAQCDRLLERKVEGRELHPDVRCAIKQLKATIGEDAQGGSTSAGGTSEGMILCDIARFFEVLIKARLQSGVRLGPKCKKCQKDPGRECKNTDCIDVGQSYRVTKLYDPGAKLYNAAALELPRYCTAW